MGQEDGDVPAAVIKAIDAFLDAAPKYTETEPLYRGMRVGREMFIAMKPGATVSDRGFQSASSSLGEAQAFAKVGKKQDGIPVVMEIKAGKHKSGASMEFVTASPGENEVLFKRGARFKVLTRRLLEHPKKGEYTHLELEEV